MKEIWKPIKGYENGYEISNMGRVKSLYWKRIRKAHPDKYGYLKLTLHKKGEIKAKRIHRLVAKTFIPNPENNPQVNHKDGDKLNNNVDNLEWVTDSENKYHAYKIGLYNKKKRLTLMALTNYYIMADTFTSECHSCRMDIDRIVDDIRPTCDDCLDGDIPCLKKDPCKCEIFCGCGNPMGSLEEEWGVCRECI